MFGLPLRDAQRGLARDAAHRALQLPHARLARVARGDVHQRVVGDFELVFTQAVLARLARDEVLPRDVQLLLVAVAREVDDLHAVAQGGGNRPQLVRRRDEEDFREVERQVEVVVNEGVVLLRVEYLKERGGRVAAVVHAELVYLVEHHHGIVDSGAA